MPVTLAERPIVSEGDTDVAAISYDEVLDSGELLSTVTVVEVNTTDLTIDNKAVSTAQLTIDGQTVAIGRAAQFRVSGQSASAGNADGLGVYRIRVTVTTDATPARTLVRDVLLTAR